MQTIRLGKSGLVTSRLCLGTMTFGAQADEAASRAIMDTCFDAGLNFIDTANVYPLDSKYADKGGTELIIGRWIKDKRSRVILATKGASPMGPGAMDTGISRKHLLDAVDASLKRLQTDYIDLYQLHRDDMDTPLDEMLSALDIIVRSGRARYVGVSNFTAWRIARALGRAEVLGTVKPISVQPRYNLLFRQFERELLPMCQAEGLGVICYNPLAAGFLTGKHRKETGAVPGSRLANLATERARASKDRYWQDETFAFLDEFKGIAQQLGIEPATLAIAWVLHNPAITCPIIGASRPDQLAAVLRAPEVTLAPEVLARLDTLSRQFRKGDAIR